MKNLPDFTFIGSPLAISLHDAGAANLVIGWLKSSAMPDVRVHVGGPAETLWCKAFPQIATMTLSEALCGAVALLSGTGWESMLEHNAMMMARRLGIPIFAAVDHWVNYRQRFVREGIEILPDEVWVSDQYAVTEVKKQLPEVNFREFKNVYLREQVSTILALGSTSKEFTGTIKVLYALEPIRQTWATEDNRQGEFQALDYFLSRLSLLGLDKTCEIKLRPHPSDFSGKYDHWIASVKDAHVFLSLDESIADAVAWADVVAGCESFVLIIGLEAGRKVVSTLPPWSHKLRLPHSGIISLRDL